jgi:hypothetical protein
MILDSRYPMSIMSTPLLPAARKRRVSPKSEGTIEAAKMGSDSPMGLNPKEKVVLPYQK